MKTIQKTIAAVGLAACSLLVYMFALAHQNRMITHRVQLGGERKASVFFISDIHRRRVSKRMIRQLRSHPVEAVIVGGDTAEKGVPVKRVERNLKLLATLGPLYTIFGNNDQEIGTENLLRAVERAGGVMLVNDTAALPGHPAVGICGVDDPSNGKVDIARAARSAENFQVKIVAVHNPYLFPKINQAMDADVLLAGHTHGGQIRFLHWGLQKKGRFEQTERGAALISNGYGTTLLPLRLGAKPECHLLELFY